MTAHIVDFTTDRALQQRCLAWQNWPVAAVVFCSIAFYGLLHTPVPGANEPCTLSKAHHLWDSHWCRRDLFLNSANPHFLFCLTFGFLTNWLSFPAVAWLGRIVAWLILAGGWTSFVSSIVPKWWSPIGALWAFLSLQSLGNLSGEWLVGGIEGKVLSYGCVFWCFGFLFDKHFVVAAACAGLAIGFHPVIGIWHLLAMLFAFASLMVSNATSGPALFVSGTFAQLNNKAILSMALWANVMFLAGALPGLIPCLWILNSASPSLNRNADAVAVFIRLPHHLDPTIFAIESFAGYGIMTVGWLMLRGCIRKEPVELFFAWYIKGSLLIFLNGLYIGFFIRDPFLMKFYPFRLYDIMMPIALAITTMGALDRLIITITCQSQSSWTRLASLRIVVLFALPLANLIAICLYNRSATDSYSHPSPEWRELCSWVRHNTPQDSLFLIVPIGSGLGRSKYSAFKWYAQRAEYFRFKDFPQDSESIVEWNRRRLLIEALDSSLYSFREIAIREKIDYIIIDGQFESGSCKVVHNNNEFAIVDMRP